MPDLPLTGPFALVSALICYFGVRGLSIEINTEFPFQSGLGGSGAVAIALIGALHTALDEKVPDQELFPSILQTAHNLEDSLFRNTGMQDQAAALYGGANLWEWQYSNHLKFKRQQLASDLPALSKNILLAYTGRPHLQTRNGSQMLERFKETSSLGLIKAISDQARSFGQSIESKDYRSAGKALAAEYSLRTSLLPISHANDLELIEMATNAQCGVSVTGNGGGGCIWAIGEKQDIADLRDNWNAAFERRKEGTLLRADPTNVGLEVRLESVREGQTRH